MTAHVMEAPMENQNKQPQSQKSAGGIFIAFGGIAGVLLGGIMGQPSIGLLAGLAFGALIALALWLRERGNE